MTCLHRYRLLRAEFPAAPSAWITLQLDAARRGQRLAGELRRRLDRKKISSNHEHKNPNSPPRMEPS